MKPESSCSSEEGEVQSVISSDDDRSENDAHVEIGSDGDRAPDGESDTDENSRSCTDESAEEGNKRKRKLLQ